MEPNAGDVGAAEWPAQWLRGALPLCALAVIRDHGPVHGYGITRELSGRGLGEIGGGTLYPLLGRLERDDLVTTAWVAGANGPARKVYVITDAGQGHLHTESAAWRSFCLTTTTALDPRPTDPQEDS